MDIKFLVSIILPIISIVGVIINFFYTRKQDKIGLMFKTWQVYFEENKEKIRQQEKITFSVMTDRKEKLMNDFLKFKIQYYDLIGNRYEQEFKFGYYDDFNGKDEKYYSLNNTSYSPELVEENKYE